MKKTTLRPILCTALMLGMSAAALSAQTPSASPGSAPAGAPPPPPPVGILPPPPPPSALFRALDTNGDGVISADEINNAAAALKALAGPSGQITRDTLRPARPERDDHRAAESRPHFGPRPEDRPHHRPMMDAQDDPAAGPECPGAHGPRPAHWPDDRAYRLPPPPHGDRLFETLDANHDGVISADELAAALQEAEAHHEGIIHRRGFRPPPPPPVPAGSPATGAPTAPDAPAAKTPDAPAALKAPTADAPAVSVPQG